MAHDVVITGIGLLCSLASSAQALYENVINNRKAYRTVRLAREPFQKEYPASLVDLSQVPLPSSPNLRKMGRASLFALNAAQSALDDSGLRSAGLEETGLVIATQSGELNNIEQFYLSFFNDGPSGASPFYFPGTVLNITGGFVGIHYGIKGPCHTFSSRETTGLEALGYAWAAIRSGSCHRVLVIGTEELSPAFMRAYQDIGIIAGSEDSEPFRRAVAAEGACALLLEDKDSALQRKAPVHATIEAVSKRQDSLSNGRFDLLISGKNGYGPLDSREDAFTSSLSIPRHLVFKPLTGEFFGASGLFATALGCVSPEGHVLVCSCDTMGAFSAVSLVKP